MIRRAGMQHKVQVGMFLQHQHSQVRVLMSAIIIVRPSQCFGETGEKGYLFQGNRGTKVKFWGEQEKKDNIGEQET